ncbi:MAG: head completion/stabilization protein [Rhodocyclales bacterium]|nr:head completion/stabilization protein [Rhodocyclales bacterium]
MSFIVPAPTPATEEAEIVSGPFWPHIDPATVREAHNIDHTVSPIRLRVTLIEAIAATNGELRAWRLARQAEGTATLAEVEAEQIDETSILVQRYHRAVGSHAKALLLERTRDFDSTAKGDKEADALAPQIDDHWRDYRRAIGDITGAGRTTVELI